MRGTNALRDRLRAHDDVPPSCLVYTPPSLADAIVSSLGDDASGDWLDPCTGKGVFLSSLRSQGIPAGRIRAIDLASEKESRDALARTLRPCEFLAWSLDTRERFTRIVANPPYVALSKLGESIRRSALAVPVLSGGYVPGKANCWYAFLCAALFLLKEGGSLGFILPAAWEYAEYAARLREDLSACFQVLEIHRSHKPLFPAVQEGSVVLIGRRFESRSAGQVSSGTVRFEYADERALSFRLQQSGRTLNSRAAGLSCASPDPVRVFISPSSRATPLREVMRIQLGGVTGDSDYFLLSESRRQIYGLPVSCLRPVVSRANHLRSGHIDTKYWQDLRLSGERVWLFHPTPSCLTNESVQRYLDLSEAEGGCRRSALKIRSRDPWFQTKLPKRVEGFISGMSSHGPWVVFRSMPRLTATNTLYVITFLMDGSVDSKAAWSMWLLTSEARELLNTIRRQYPDGLIKFEPGDISKLPVRRPRRTANAFVEYLQAIRQLLSGDAGGSMRIADRWF